MSDLIDYLRRYNEWRRGAETAMPEPQEIGEYLDAAIEALVTLERERDEARDALEGWRNKWEFAVDMAARAELERDLYVERSEKALYGELSGLLGVSKNEAPGEKLKAGVESVKRIIRERNEAREDVAILRLDAQREAEHHDRMVKELEGLYDQNAKLRDIAERAIELLINPPALSIFPTLALHNKEHGKQLRAELDQLKEGAK